MRNIRSYTELRKLKTFEERFDYLRLDGEVGKETFGWERYFNQRFYASREWRQIRRDLIVRDNGCDLGVEGYEMNGLIIIHHMNPITMDDIERASSYLTDPEYLICVSKKTHNAIHYGILDMSDYIPVERTPNDTAPWKK